MNRLYLLLTISLAVFSVGCTHVARMEDLPTAASAAPFDRAANASPRSAAMWTQETKFEHYIEVGALPVNDLRRKLEDAMTRSGYSVKNKDISSQAFIGTRGLSMMEWGSVAGIYYRVLADRIQVLVSVHITQDITGSPRHNPAWDVGDEICRDVGFCKVRR
jgi:hypothetical protein